MTPVVQKQVPLLNLRAQHKAIRDEVLAAITRVVDSQKFILGEDVGKLEEEIAAYCGARYAVGCASGSDALLHANAYHMAVVEEPLRAAVARIAAAGSPVTGVRRLTP